MNVCLWVEENQDNINHYQEFGILDLNVVAIPEEEQAPFCLAV